MELNFDCLLLIFETLPLIELLTMVETNNSLFPLIETAFRSRISKKVLILRNPIDEHPKYADLNVEEFDDRIEIGHILTIHRILRNFGNLITNLKILKPFKLSDSEAKKIYRNINIHCADTLTHFHLKDQYHDVFAEFKRPFNAMETLYLEGYFTKVENANATFNMIFPSLRRLILESVNIHLINVSDQKMSQLEHFETENFGSFKTSSIKQLIENNPQIRSLSLKAVRPNLLQFVAEKLPRLQNLTLDYYVEDSEHIDGSGLNFRHLKRLEMRGSNMPSNITFGELEELTVYVTKQKITNLIDLIMDYRVSLRKLWLVVYLTNQEVLQIANANLKLIELRFTCENDVEVQSIVKLIEVSTELRRLDIHFFWGILMQSTFEELEKRFAYKWTITKNEHFIALR